MGVLQCRFARVAAGPVAGAILITAAIGLSWPSGADAAIVITQKPDLSGGYPGGLPVYDVGGQTVGEDPGGGSPTRGLQNPWTPLRGFQGPSALGGDQKGQRPFDLVRLLYNRSKRPASRIAPASFSRARTEI